MRSWQDDLVRLQKEIEREHEVTLVVYPAKAVAPNWAHVASVLVADGARGLGRGTAAMDDLVTWADENGVTLSLTDRALPGYKAKLRRWYLRFGFRPNKGRAKDFRTRDTLIREPA